VVRDATGRIIINSHRQLYYCDVQKRQGDVYNMKNSNYKYVNTYDGQILRYKEENTHQIIPRHIIQILTNLNDEPDKIFHFTGNDKFDFTISQVRDELVHIRPNYFYIYDLNAILLHEFQVHDDELCLSNIIYDFNTYLCSQYDHIGLLKSNGDVLIYATSGQLIHTWNSEIVDICPPEWDDRNCRCFNCINHTIIRCYNLIMLPNNFVAIIEIIVQDLNIYIYKLNGTLYKKINIQQIIKDPIERMSGMILYANCFIYNKQLTLAYNDHIYMLPCV
jgi:hypothetical protein